MRVLFGILIFLTASSPAFSQSSSVSSREGQPKSLTPEASAETLSQEALDFLEGRTDRVTGTIEQIDLLIEQLEDAATSLGSSTGNLSWNGSPAPVLRVEGLDELRNQVEVLRSLSDVRQLTGELIGLRTALNSHIATQDARFSSLKDAEAELKSKMNWIQGLFVALLLAAIVGPIFASIMSARPKV